MHWLIQHPHADEISGVSTYVSNLEIALVERGHVVEVVSSRTDSLRRRLSALRRADVLHANSNDVLLLLLARTLRKPVLLKYHWPFWLSTIHRYEPKSFPDRLWSELTFILRTQRDARGPFGVLRAVTRLVGRLACIPLATTVTACSTFTARAFDMGDRVKFLPNPIGTPVTATAPEGDSEPDPVILYVGRLTNTKGVDLAIRAFASALVQDEDLSASRLLIAGDGEELQALQSLTNSLGMASNIEFLGRVPNSLVSGLMQDSVALVFPIRWEDPAPYPPLEAALSGRVTIGFDLGGLRETATDSARLAKSGDLDALSDFIRETLQKPSDALALGAEARAKALSVYSADNALRRMQEIFPEGFRPT